MSVSHATTSASTVSRQHFGTVLSTLKSISAILPVRIVSKDRRSESITIQHLSDPSLQRLVPSQAEASLFHYVLHRASADLHAVSTDWFDRVEEGCTIFLGYCCPVQDWKVLLLASDL